MPKPNPKCQRGFRRHGVEQKKAARRAIRAPGGAAAHRSAIRVLRPIGQIKRWPTPFSHSPSRVGETHRNRGGRDVAGE